MKIIRELKLMDNNVYVPYTSKESLEQGKFGKLWGLEIRFDRSIDDDSIRIKYDNVEVE